MLTTPEQLYLQQHYLQQHGSTGAVKDGGRLLGSLANYIANPHSTAITVHSAYESSRSQVVLPPQNQLNVAELRRMMQEREVRSCDTFRVILERAYRMVRRTAACKRYACSFDVPWFVPNHPMYDMIKCVEHVVKNLTGNGFAVQYVQPRTILISWAYIQGRENGMVMASIARLQERSIADAMQAQQQQQQRHEEQPADEVDASPASTEPPRQEAPVVQDDANTHRIDLRSVSTLDDVAQQRRARQPAGRALVGGEAFKDIAQFKPSGKFVLQL